MLTTNGGSADAAYRIARQLQSNYEKVTLFVHSVCKSAGTLVALGCHEVVMSDLAEMGPLDVQLAKADELFESTSGLTPRQAFETLQQEVLGSFEDFFLSLRGKSGFQITTKTAAEIATKLTTGLFSPVYSQIDPMRLGEIQRAMMIAMHYGSRLDRGNVEDGAVARLLTDYPCHEFVIDRTEARELFKTVRGPTQAEELLGEIHEADDDEDSHSVIRFLNDERLKPEQTEFENEEDAPSESGVQGASRGFGGAVARAAAEINGDDAAVGGLN
jgi:hypothetical protein